MNGFSRFRLSCVVSGFRRETDGTCAITQLIVVISYWRFGTASRSHLHGQEIQETISWISLPWPWGWRFGTTSRSHLHGQEIQETISWISLPWPTGCPETSVRNYYIRCVSQKSAELCDSFVFIMLHLYLILFCTGAEYWYINPTRHSGSYIYHLI